MAPSAGLEPAFFCLEGRCLIPLDYEDFVTGPHLPTGHFVFAHCVFSLRIQPHFLQTLSLLCSHVAQTFILSCWTSGVVRKLSNIIISEWSRVGESNSFDQLGRLGHNQYANSAIWCDWSDLNRQG